ncbi:hypothetical protein FNO01nite_06550 [Flavobacterium noncentrifugens]|uniref:Uncharacterized protein n=1 Tax=Flavobacterium noncentrifugens TaxID=1128970 RepID=A0A1G8SXD6_9FLAO|nr:hypothetical protein [Flavobacterium noncentrifugens]GEP49983.1 hypothetical protein FNO01nite_06550 [Flavobacterium noncentrifugens]SDJ33230.1 hypothetical protein SAMN04487935_0715 [Flavobacterium noncentrifugens]
MKNLFLSVMILVGVCASAQEAKKTTKEQTKTESVTSVTPEAKKAESSTTSTTVKSADNGTAKSATKTETTTTVPAEQAAQKPKSDATKPAQ